MTRYSVQARDGIFAKGYGLLLFAKYMGTNIGKNIINLEIQTKHGKKGLDDKTPIPKGSLSIALQSYS